MLLWFDEASSRIELQLELEIKKTMEAKTECFMIEMVHLWMCVIHMNFVLRKLYKAAHSSDQLRLAKVLSVFESKDTEQN